MTQLLTHPLPLHELHRIKRWHMEHAKDHPLEYETWDAVLTLWFMGWVGWLPTYVLDAWWGALPCVLGMLAPQLYVGWRAHCHMLHRLRCDWLEVP